MHDEVEGMIVEIRLREISDQITQLKAYLIGEPNNALLINLLEAERRALVKEYIRGV